MKNIKTFEEFLNEGTWALEQDKIDNYIDVLNSIKSPKEINDKLYKEWWNVVGDDILYDFLDSAKDNKGGKWKSDVEKAILRLEELKKAKKVK